MAAHEFSVGRVLARTMSLWARHWLPFTLLALIGYLPDMAFRFVVSEHPNAVGSTLRLALSTVIGTVGGLFATAAITFGVTEDLRGRRSFSQAMVGGLGRIVPTLRTSLVAGVLIGGATLLLVLPGWLLCAVLFVAVPAAVVERDKGDGALARSWELTRGHRLKIMGIVLLVWVVGFGAIKLYVVLLGDGHLAVPPSVHYFLGYPALAVLLQPMDSVAAVVAYVELRRTQEGPDAVELAGVFE